MGTLRFALLAAMIVLFVHKGESLKCWYCDSMRMRGCSEPFLGSADVKEDNDFIKDCESEIWKHHIQILPNGTTDTEIVNPGLKFVCLKLIGKFLGEIVVSRDCALGFPNITEASCVQSVSGSHSSLQKRLPIKIEKCETCSGDLCNAAVSVGKTAVLIVLVLQFLLLLKYQY